MENFQSKLKTPEKTETPKEKNAKEVVKPDIDEQISGLLNDGIKTKQITKKELKGLVEARKKLLVARLTRRDVKHHFQADQIGHFKRELTAIQNGTWHPGMQKMPPKKSFIRN